MLVNEYKGYDIFRESKNGAVMVRIRHGINLVCQFTMAYNNSKQAFDLLKMSKIMAQNYIDQHYYWGIV